LEPSCTMQLQENVLKPLLGFLSATTNQSAQ